MNIGELMDKFQSDLNKKKGGFIDHAPIDDNKGCRDPEHLPPGMIVLKPGKHTYKCPECGHITVINVPSITLSI